MNSSSVDDLATKNSDGHFFRLVLVVLVSLLLNLSALGSTKLWDADEGFFVSTASEMYAHRDWIVPTFNGKVFGHKPPWMYWLMMTGFHLFGRNEFAARIPTALFGVLTACLTYRLGAMLFNERVGFYSGLVLPTCLMFNVVSHAATPDVSLVFFITLALYLFARPGLCRVNFADDQTSQLKQGFRFIRWSDWILIYTCLSLAVLVKGPIGILLPMAVIGLFGLCTTAKEELAAGGNWKVCLRAALRPWGPRNFLKTVWHMRPFTAIAALFVIAGPWFVIVGLKTNGQFLYDFFVVHHLHRFTSAMENHGGSFFYYPVSIMAGTFPWSFFAVPVILESWHQRGTVRRHWRPIVFLGCWIGVFVGLFSLSATKLSNYVLPVYPPIAILVGVYFEQLRSLAPRHLRNVKVQLAALSMLLVGALFLIGLPIIASMKLNGLRLLERIAIAPALQNELGWLGLLGIPVMLAGAVTLWCSRGMYVRQFGLKNIFPVTFASAVLFLAMIWLWYAPRFSRFQTPQRLAERAAEFRTAHPDQTIVAFDFFRPSMVYYAQQNIVRSERVCEIPRLVGNATFCLIITNEQGYRLLNDAFSNLELVSEVSNFPKSGQLYLVKTEKSFRETSGRHRCWEFID